MFKDFAVIMLKIYFILTVTVLVTVDVHGSTISYGKYDADHNYHRNIQKFRAVPKNNVGDHTYDNSVNWNTVSPSPPPHSKAARMARYIVHYSDWGTLAYISINSKSPGYPTGSVFSVSDGPVNNGSGVPYFYVTMLEEAPQAFLKDSRATLTLTLAQGQYCAQHDLDPEYPLCPQLVLYGQMERLNNGTQEWDTAKNALFPRHPSMSSWPPDHKFFFMKLNIESISLLDYFGGPKDVNLKDYFNAKPARPKKYKPKWRDTHIIFD